MWIGSSIDSYRTTDMRQNRSTRNVATLAQRERYLLSYGNELLQILLGGLFWRLGTNTPDQFP